MTISCKPVVRGVLLLGALAAQPGMTAETVPSPCPISEAILHPEHAALKDIAIRLDAKRQRQIPTRIVALGSSSTQGYGAASAEQSYPHRLQVELTARLPGLSLEVINAGIGGQTILTMAERIDADVLSRDPDLVIWQVGSNALLRGVDFARAEAALAGGIARLQARSVPVVLMGMQFAPRIVENSNHRQMRALIIRTGQQFKVPVFDRYGLMQFWEQELSERELDEWIHPDGLHMTTPSYRCLATALAEYLLALRPR